MTIKGPLRYKNTWPKGIRVLEDDIIDVEKLMSFKFSLKDADQAFIEPADPRPTDIEL